MGTVTIIHKGKGTQHDGPSWFASNIKQNEWEEKVEETRPFHRDCYKAYKKKTS